MKRNLANCLLQKKKKNLEYSNGLRNYISSLSNTKDREYDWAYFSPLENKNSFQETSIEQKQTFYYYYFVKE